MSTDLDPNDDPRPGERHAGCVLGALLGKGAMGSVYAARRERDGADVVVKFLASEYVRDEALRARFQREWEALSKLEPHPNVVEVLDVVSGGERPCLVLEFVPGETLEAVLEREGRLEPQRALAVARDLALGLAAVHVHGLIHRDVKPANVMLTPAGGAKLVDFGLAKDLFLSGLTQPGEILGTANYMAPEQWEDEGVDRRTDVFALGATLYHCLCGAAPFEGEDMNEVADACTSGDYAPPEELNPGLSPEITGALARMLQTQPQDRYPSMKACADDLDAILAGGHAQVPRLEGAGRRFPLIPGEFFTIGTDPSAPIRLEHPSVAFRHAQIRRQLTGFVLRDLKSASGTWLDGQRLAVGRGYPLSPGARLRVGEVELVFEAPAQGGEASAAANTLLEDARRVSAPDPVLAAAAALNDPRAVLSLIEGLAAPRPSFALERLLGAQVARAVLTRRIAQAPAQSAARIARLNAITGLAIHDPAAWFAWWHQVRTTAPEQLVASRFGLTPPTQSLSVRGEVPALDVPLRASVVLVGRDPRCTLRLEHPGLARLHVSLLRLDARWIAIDEGSPGGIALQGQRVRAAALDPGQVLNLGPVQLALIEQPPEPQPLPSGFFPLDPADWRALVELQHPAVCAGLLGLLWEPSAPWLEQAIHQQASEAAPPERWRAALAGVHERDQAQARALLPAWLGPHGDPAAWRAAFAQTRAQLGAQVVPAGWLETTRA